MILDKLKKNEKYIKIILILLTIINLVFVLLNFSRYLYLDFCGFNNRPSGNLFCTNCFCDSLDFLSSTLNKFNLIMIVENIFMCIFALLFSIVTISKRKNMIVNISFCIFSVLSSYAVLRILSYIIGKILFKY